MEKKIIFIDIDGTIVDSPNGLHSPSRKTEYAIKELIKNGHEVFIASGRARCMLLKELKEIDGLNFVTTNGAFACRHNGEVLVDEEFPKEMIEEVNQYCKDNGYMYFDESQDVVEVEDITDPRFKKYVTDWGISLDVFKTYEGNIKFYMMMALFKTKEELKSFKMHFKGRLEIEDQYASVSVDIGLPGINKGYGVRKVLEKLNIDPKDAYAFGDGNNDVDMLKSVGNSYAMDNANFNAKSAAKYIAPSVAVDGFYAIMVKDGLIDPLEE